MNQRARSPRVDAVPQERRLDLRTLFDGHYGSIWRLLRRLGVRTAQLDDAAQEVFWVAARRLGHIVPGSEAAFLYGVALRVAASEVRRQASSAPLAALDDVAPLGDGRPSPDEQLEQSRARALLDDALDRLPHELRAVLVLVEIEGLEVREVAAIEGIPLGTASSRLRRAREEFGAIARRMRARLGLERGDG